MSDSPQEITRREVLKRGAVVGATVLWVTPVVQTLGMGRAFAATPSDECSPSCAVNYEGFETSTVGFLQGETRTLGPITDSRRTDPVRALGTPNSGFFSLGYRGWIILKLGQGYFAGKGGEALVIETTNGAGTSPGSYPLEKAEVFVSVNQGGPWRKLVGVLATNKNAGPDFTKTKIVLDDVLFPNELVNYVKLVDVTDPADHSDETLFGDPLGSSDAFDIESLCVTCPATPA